jgi:hypothetical protein
MTLAIVVGYHAFPGLHTVIIRKPEIVEVHPTDGAGSCPV